MMRITEGQLRKVIREEIDDQAPRFTPKQHRLASRLIDQLNDAAMDLAIDRVKRDNHFLTPDEANVLFNVLFDEMGMGRHFATLEALRAAHSESLDILMRARGEELARDRWGPCRRRPAVAIWSGNRSLSALGARGSNGT